MSCLSSRRERPAQIADRLDGVPMRGTECLASRLPDLPELAHAFCLLPEAHQ